MRKKSISKLKDNIIIPTDSTLYSTFQGVTTNKRAIFFAGLPGVGKSLLLQQLTMMAVDVGREVYLLQWDVARQPFETDAHVLQHYPEIDGVTSGVVRKAVGLWGREAVAQWHMTHPHPNCLLVGEVPLIGNRWMELAQTNSDSLEPLLSSEATEVLIPVPSRKIRRMIEGRREASSANPQHEREKADAIPEVLRGLWLEVYRVAVAFGLADAVPNPEQLTYDPAIYQGVYEALLKHRQHQTLHLDMMLDTKNLSAYDLNVHQGELIPTPAHVKTHLTTVEQQYPDPTVLDEEIARWYVV